MSCYRHGFSNTRIYGIWQAMKKRCKGYTKINKKYYKDRKIKVCKEWLDKEDGFMNFYNWSMANGYKDDLTIDRIDVNGNYEPNNCRWATMKEQANNTTYNIFYEFKGQIKTQQQWCDIYKISPATFKDRLKRGWSLEDALTIPTKGLKRKLRIYKTVYQIDKNTDEIIDTFYNISEAERITSINYQSIYDVCKGKNKTAGGYKWKYAK